MKSVEIIGISNYKHTHLHLIPFIAATFERLDCPVGTYRDSLNGASVEDCAPCDPGWYCLTKSETPTGLCEPGYYCPSPFDNVDDNGTGPLMIGSYGSR